MIRPFSTKYPLLNIFYRTFLGGLLCEWVEERVNTKFSHNYSHLLVSLKIIGE